MDFNRVFFFICTLNGCSGNCYVNVTQTGCLRFDLNKNAESESISMRKDSSLVFQSIYTGANDVLLVIGNFTGRITDYDINRHEGTLSFCIVNTTIFDGGVYHIDLTIRNMFRKLYVLDMPTKPLISIKRNGIIDSENGVLSCLSYSTSAPPGLPINYKWWVNDTIIINWNKYKCNSNNACNELINTVDKKDKFNDYRCVATEEYGQTSEFSDIGEIDPKYRPTVTVSPDYNQYNMIENTTILQFTCNVTDANPAVTSYRWYKGSSLISNMAIYTIPTVLRSHTGSYKCDATNSVGTSIPSSALQLNVLYGLEINPIGKAKPLEGTQLAITCSGQSYPVMTSGDVKWYKQNNNSFNRVGLHLVIDNVNRLDSGTYVCSAVIQLIPTFGQTVNVTGSTTVEVDVLYRPDVTVSPDINPYHITENTTNVYLTCMIKAANPSVTSYAWYKNGFQISTSSIYIISTVYRSHTGSYTCDATNVVGSSDITPALHLDVLYGVSLKLSGTEVNINESQRLDLACIVDSNPLPYIIWIYNNNGTIVGEQKANVTHINVEHANCVDTGLYMCYANNSIGEPVSQSADIKVACKPRTYNNLDRVDILMRATDESINISTTFISFPLSHISWSRELSDGHLEDLDSSFKSFTIPSHLPYKTIAILQKDQLKPNEFGIYLVNASNMYGSFKMKYHFIQKRDPLLPSYVYVICKSTTAIVILKPIVNENLPQDLNIQYAVEGKDMTSIKVHMNAANQPVEYTVTGLNPGMKYNFSILAVNLFGETRSKQFECLTETFCSKEDMLEVKENNSGMFIAGIASLVIGLLFFVAAAIFILHKRFKKTYTKSSKSDEYSDLQTSNPAFQDPYTSLQNPIESRHHQESIANTYEECGNASDVAAYQNIENMKSGHKKAEKNMGIYDNMKI